MKPGAPPRGAPPRTPSRSLLARPLDCRVIGHGHADGLLLSRAADEDPGLDGTVGEVAPAALHTLWLLRLLPNMLSSHLAILHHAEGPSNTITTACAAGTQAIGEAFVRLSVAGGQELLRKSQIDGFVQSEDTAYDVIRRAAKVVR